jgi:hypothetical protein
VLVANRGEIARRVIKTCNRLGVPTVAVYTNADALAPHVKEATKAACLGANPRGYTNQELLLQARTASSDRCRYCARLMLIGRSSTACGATCSAASCPQPCSAGAPAPWAPPAPDARSPLTGRSPPAWPRTLHL